MTAFNFLIFVAAAAGSASAQIQAYQTRGTTGAQTIAIVDTAVAGICHNCELTAADRKRAREEQAEYITIVETGVTSAVALAAAYDRIMGRVARVEFGVPMPGGIEVWLGRNCTYTPWQCMEYYNTMVNTFGAPKPWYHLSQLKLEPQQSRTEIYHQNIAYLGGRQKSSDELVAVVEPPGPNTGDPKPKPPRRFRDLVYRPKPKYTRPKVLRS